MTRKDKLLQKIKNNPRSTSFGDVRQLLIDVGFAERQPKSGSSHHICYYTALELVVVLVKGHDPFPEYQVKDALRALYLLGGESGHWVRYVGSDARGRYWMRNRSAHVKPAAKIPSATAGTCLVV